MSIRMKDIATDLGLSVVTISKVLHNHPDIAEETRERVLERMRELDYQPNLMARSLVTGRSQLIGLVVPSFMHPFFAQVAKALSVVVAERGYSLIFASSEEDPKLEAREVEQMIGRRLDALVIACSGTDRSLFERVQRKGMPYVLIDRDIPGLAANFVGVNDQAAGRLATQHLLDQGCRSIAHIRGRDNSTGRGRFEGYKQALLDGGIRYSDALVVAQPSVDIDSMRLGAEAMNVLLQRRPKPDGVFAHNDPLAMGAMNAILDAGLRIPEDVALIGCGNLLYNSSLRVPLSSVDQNSSAIGEQTGHILLRMIEGKNPAAPTRVILEPSLVVRSSSERSTRRQNGKPPSARASATPRRSRK